MEIRDWITILSVIIIMVGWFINSWLNRKNEIAKVCLKYRLDALTPIINVVKEINEYIASGNVDVAHLQHILADMSYNLGMYGKKDEIEYWKEIINTFNKEHKIEEKQFNEFVEFIKSRIRKELNLS